MIDDCGGLLGRCWSNRDHLSFYNMLHNRSCAVAAFNNQVFKVEEMKGVTGPDAEPKATFTVEDMKEAAPLTDNHPQAVQTGHSVQGASVMGIRSCLSVVRQVLARVSLQMRREAFFIVTIAQDAGLRAQFRNEGMSV